MSKQLMRLHLSSCRWYPAELRALYDLMIFVNVDDDTRLARRVRRDIIERGRDVLQVLDQYERSVKPSFTQFILPTKQYAHIIVSASACRSKPVKPSFTQFILPTKQYAHIIVSASRIVLSSPPTKQYANITVTASACQTSLRTPTRHSLQTYPHLELVLRKHSAP